MSFIRLDTVKIVRSEVIFQSIIKWSKAKYNIPIFIFLNQKQNMKPLNLDDVVLYIEQNIGVFHQKKDGSIDWQKLVAYNSAFTPKTK